MKHRCVGTYTGMAKLTETMVVLSYRCQKCGEVWNEEVLRDVANVRHPHLAGDTIKCQKCGKWHRPAEGAK